MSSSIAWIVRPARAVSAMAFLLAGTFPIAARAEFEEVLILRAEPVQVQTCAAPSAAQAPRPQGGVTGREIAGGVAGAAVGGLLGNQIGSGSGRTAATVIGAGVGGYAGYKLAEEKPQQQPIQQTQSTCTVTTQYRVLYSRQNGTQGDLMMSSQPTSTSLLVNFCGDRPCN